jgi:hypothetical protein
MKNGLVEQWVQTWQDQLATISRNITDLAEAEFARRIKNRMRGFSTPAYRGRTLEQSKTAFAALDSLLGDYLLLDSVVTQAANLAKRQGIFQSYEEEVRALLHGPSVRLPEVHIPLTSRGLLDSATKSDAVTPSVLLEAMKAAFERANLLLNEIDAAETASGAYQQNLGREADALNAWAAKLGLMPKAEVLAQVADAQADPLSAAAELEQLELRFDNWRKELEQAEQAHQALRDGLVRGNAGLDALEDLSSRSRLAIDETRLRVAGSHDFLEPASREARATHRAWLTRLDETVAAGRWDAARIGLERFEASIESQLNAERAAYTHNRKRLDELTELTGRFKALREKARIVFRRGAAASDSLQDMQAAIEATLGGKPTNLPLLHKQVGAYETTLLALPVTTHRTGHAPDEGSR